MHNPRLDDKSKLNATNQLIQEELVKLGKIDKGYLAKYLSPGFGPLDQFAGKGEFQFKLDKTAAIKGEYGDKQLDEGSLNSLQHMLEDMSKVLGNKKMTNEQKNQIINDLITNTYQVNDPELIQQLQDVLNNSELNDEDKEEIMS